MYQYDDLGQVISGRRYWADGTPVAGQQFEYGFDDIGNRTTTGGRESAVSTYTVNDLNQYLDRSVPNVVDVFGIANSIAVVTVRVGGRRFCGAHYFPSGYPVPGGEAFLGSAGASPLYLSLVLLPGGGEDGCPPALKGRRAARRAGSSSPWIGL